MKRILRTVALVAIGVATGCALAAGAYTALWAIRDASAAAWAFLATGRQHVPLLWGIVIADYGCAALLGVTWLRRQGRRASAEQPRAPYLAPRAPWARR